MGNIWSRPPDSLHVSYNWKVEKQTKTSHESLGYRILATRYFHTRFVGNYSPAQSAQPSLASPAQPSAGLRRRNFHTFSTFHSFYNNLTLTQTPHTLASLLWSKGPFCCLPAHSEIVFSPNFKNFSVFWFHSFIPTDCHLCRCRISPVWFSSDIHRTNPARGKKY